MTDTPLLAIDRLSAGFESEEGYVRVIENVSFEVQAGETVGLVGESGCGKSVTAQTIMRLLPSPPARIETGRILFEGIDLARLPEREMRKIRGERIGMIFQEPMTSLNPTMTIGRQIAEVLILHRGLSRSQAMPRVVELLRTVGIGGGAQRIGQYPHQLSGGLRQRVMIAMALICHPRLLIADEPTTALDVTIQAQIIELLKRLQAELGLSILLITHDLGVVAELCRKVAIMYAGRIVETGATRDVLRNPRHPYTAGLMAASPRLARKGRRLASIPGQVPPPGRRGRGCGFAERCPRALERCRAEAPDLAAGAAGHAIACWNPAP